MRKLLFILTILLLGLNLFAKQVMTNGIYIDSQNNKHNWKINATNAVIWEEKPFLPCGFKITFKSLEDTNNTELLQEDINVINELYSNGISDILISNGSSLTISNPTALNKIIEYLDQKDMTYGLDLSEESTTTLKGYIVNPAIYRLEGPYPDTTIVKMWDNVDSGLFTIVNKASGDIVDKGSLAKSNNGQIIIKLNKKLTANEVLLVYPHLNLFNNFDLWQGYDEIRDNIIKYFKNIKLGKGFRFFYNPFNLDKLCSVVDSSDFIPTSSGFNLEFENYLTKNYFHGPSLAFKWNINYDDKLLPNISDFLKLFPLWNNRRGIASMYSLVTGETISADYNYSTYWQDLLLTKIISIQNNMSSITTSIKENIADVPIIFASNKTKSLTLKYDKKICDGFGYNIQDLNIDEIDNMSILFSYSEASPNTCTLMGVSNYPYTPELEDILCNSSYCGYYFNYKNTNIKDLKNLNDKMSSYTSKSIAFPSVLPLNTTLLKDNTIWYPSNEMYTSKKYNDIYAYQKKDSTDITFFTLKGKRKITIVGKNDKDCKIIYPQNKRIKKGKSAIASHEYSFEISEEPTIISNVDIKSVCPKEAVKEKLDQYESFIKESNLDPSNIKLMKKNLKDIKDVYDHSAYLNAFGMVNEHLTKLMILTGSDIWMEGENFTKTSFDKREINTDASANAVLLLDTQEDPKLGNYYVSTTIDVPFDKSYVMWLGVSKADISSPFSVSYDNNSYDKINFENSIPYSEDYVWVRGPYLNFASGVHTINIKVDDINKETLRYHLAVDCILLTDSDKKPNGIKKPKLILNL